MRFAAAILLLATAARAEEKSEWKLAKGDTIRYRLSKSVEGRHGEMRLLFSWEFTVSLRVSEVKAGVAGMEGTMDGLKYENVYPGAPPCRFDSEKDKGEVEDPLKPYKAAVGGKFRIRATLKGKVEAVEGLEDLFASKSNGHYANAAIEQFRELAALLFLDRGAKDEQGYRLGVTVSFVRPGIPVAEDVTLADTKEGWSWKGVWRNVGTDDSAAAWKLTDETGSNGTVTWAKGRLQELKVETDVSFTEPEPLKFKVVRGVSAAPR